MYAGGGGATGYGSNYYENQSNKLIIINQSTNCYSFTSLSNKTEKNAERTVIIIPWVPEAILACAI